MSVGWLLKQNHFPFMGSRFELLLILNFGPSLAYRSPRRALLHRGRPETEDQKGWVSWLNLSIGGVCRTSSFTPQNFSFFFFSCMCIGTSWTFSLSPRRASSLLVAFLKGSILRKKGEEVTKLTCFRPQDPLPNR